MIFFSWEEPGSAPGDDTLDELMNVDSVPLDPSAVETLPCNLPGDYSPGPLPEAPSSSRTLSDIDARIAELQFLGCSDRASLAECGVDTVELEWVTSV